RPDSRRCGIMRSCIDSDCSPSRVSCSPRPRRCRPRTGRCSGTAGGVAPDDPALPDTWSQTEHVVWRVDVPGIGWSSPVVWGDHVFLASVVNTAQQEMPKPGFYL